MESNFMLNCYFPKAPTKYFQLKCLNFITTTKSLFSKSHVVMLFTILQEKGIFSTNVNNKSHKWLIL